jgi:phytoene dehydrogenase-like protein
MTADAVVVGSGPNGLTAAVTLAHAGLSVEVVEASDRWGGGLRAIDATVDGVIHDEFAAVHPLALASPFFRRWGLTDRVRFIVPEISYAHPLGDETVLAYRDLERTATELGAGGDAWRRAFSPLVDSIGRVSELTLGAPIDAARHAGLAARLAMTTLDLAETFGSGTLRDAPARALLAGVAAHAIGIVPSLATIAAAIVLAAHGHAGGWAIPVGGSAAIADALVGDLVARGGRIETGRQVRSLDELDARIVLLDVAPGAAAAIASDAFPRGYRRELRKFAHGDAAARVDLLLDGPIPWRDERIGRAAAVHLGGTERQIAAGERAVARGALPDAPYVLLSQPSAHDASRAPDGKHVVWAYTHVPNGSTEDRTEAVLSAIEAAAPGVRDRVIARAHRSAAQLELSNANLVGGDIAGGAVSVSQLLRRPTFSSEPWRTPADGVYLCSASTSPGPGVHGMSGWHAARAALLHEFGLAAPFGDDGAATAA